MSGAYSRLSYNDAQEISTDVSIMGKKLMGGYLNLVGYLHRFGSVPSGERALASVLGVTTRFLREVGWPLLQDRLVLSADGQRYFDPEITAVRPPRAAAAPAAPEKSQQQEAAKKRWDTERERRRQEAAQAHAEPMRGASEPHANSMRDASETHAETDATASSDASDASPRAPASPPPLKQDSLFQPTEKKESSGGGGESSAGASEAAQDDAPHAPTHKNRMRSDAETHAPSIRPITTVAIPIPADWKPPAECRAEAERLGVDVDLENTKFVLRSLRDDGRSKNWPASFLIWCHRQVDWTKRNPQTQVPLVIPGGKAEPEAATEMAEEPIIGTTPEAQWARVQRKLGKGVARNWLGKAEIVGFEDGELTIALPKQFIRDHVVKNYGTRLTALWQVENPEIERVNLVVAANQLRATGD